MVTKSKSFMRFTVALLAIVLAAGLLALNVAPSFANGGRPFTTTLLGANEVPSPGDPDGSGTAHITLNQGQGEICFDITVNNVDTIAASHIHAAPAGTAGPVVVNFNVGANGLSGCVIVDADLIKAIRQNPENYYVNVHNPAFPSGALRGQLSKAISEK